MSFLDNKKEYKVKIKDPDNNTTHTVTEWASSQNEANSIAIKRLRKMLKTRKLEIK